MGKTTPFDNIFEAATGTQPYPFQRRFATSPNLPSFVNVPTGLGKTAMAVVGWLWRRFGGDEGLKRSTPRRLVYCLPMRVLVEQTHDYALDWLDAVGLLAGNVERESAEDSKRGRVKAHTYRWNPYAAGKVNVHILMGGEETDDWDIYPERDAIIIGTQDMLLSRALNRGYAASRARWPLAFGLLNTDCLWVFDEIQLMGSGLATTAQLEAFRGVLPSTAPLRSKNGHGCRCVWMSATMQRDWLRTVDFDPSPFDVLELAADDLISKEIGKRREAPKPLSRADASMGEFNRLAAQVVEEHSKSKGRTLVVVNTVKGACDLFETIRKRIEGTADKRTKTRKAQSALSGAPKLVLLHSRFRATDRASKVDDLPAEPGPDGTICVSTQVVEAGVDVSATTLFTELAPWASLVQRFGRCNRRGDDPNSRVFWIDIDLPDDEKKALDAARPYEPSALREARGLLEKCRDVGLSQLAPVKLSFEHTHVIRRKDLIDLFDTTPDLAGNDIDIDRYVREIEDTDVRVFWRVWDGDSPPDDREWRRIARDELCTAAVGEFRDFVNGKRGQVWHWDFLEGNWVQANRSSVYPGQTYLVHAEAGGYASDRGWNPRIEEKVIPVAKGSALPALPTEESTDDEPLSQIGRWQTIAQHADEVCNEINSILAVLPLDEKESRALMQAARWHDWGKAHEVFRKALPDGAPGQGGFWAKAAGKWKKYMRPHFRHELASALGVLGLSEDYITADWRNLVAYLIGAHHGKVRLSIRSLPGERRPANGLRFARGVWEGDPLPSVDLGGGVIAPASVLSLEPMELGYSSDGEPSWTQRALCLRDRFGPFRLAYLEALLRAADMRASARAMERSSGT
jgi:CRISPR-associated endonuclease/helicase Cas3